MNFQPFTWGSGGQKASPSSVKRQAEIAAALAAKSGAPQNVGQGLSRVGEALLHNSMVSRSEAGAAEGAAEREAIMSALMGNPDPGMSDIASALGNEWVTSDPGSSAIVQALLGQELQQNDPLRQLQLEKLGLEVEGMRNPQPEPGFTVLSAEDVAALGLPEGAYQVGPDNKVYEIGGNGTNVSIDLGGGPKLGSLSTDYGYKLDPETGQPVIDPETGLPTAAAVPGSPAALEAAALADKAAMTDERKDTATDTITDAAAIARDLATQGGATGVMGIIQGVNPESGAAELRRQTEVLTSVATIENLNQMRQSSPTGGALGNVTEGEGRMLAAAAGSLDPNASPEQYRRALDNYERTLLRIVHGREEGDRIFSETRNNNASQPQAPQIGEEVDGYVYQGGDPASPDSWKKVI